MNSFLAGIVGLFLDLLEIVVISLTIFIISYIFVFQTHQVIGDSMLPNFFNNEYLLTDKFTYKFIRQPVRGEVVIFKYPKAPQYEYIKRIVGLPGETLKVMGGSVWLKSGENWTKLNESYIASNVQTFARGFLPENKEYTVPKDDYAVMGDNREVSSDSREWGPVPKNLLVGRALIRLWPPTKFGAVIQDPSY